MSYALITNSKNYYLYNESIFINPSLKNLIVKCVRQDDPPGVIFYFFITPRANATSLTWLNMMTTKIKNIKNKGTKITQMLGVPKMQ